ncbi:hypothetical protein F5Y19DRAFT_485272 [Xylariaceae sp. FL1651]|nr:hypothetical protein F5Y19DRAFT_485272 [Xylariaceae sp. FL1651]
MDEQHREPEEILRVSGRPRKGKGSGVRGRPRKHQHGPYQARGMRAQKRPIVVPPSSKITRLAAGKLEVKDYNVRRRYKQARQHLDSLRSEDELIINNSTESIIDSDADENPNPFESESDSDGGIANSDVDQSRHDYNMDADDLERREDEMDEDYQQLEYHDERDDEMGENDQPIEYHNEGQSASNVQSIKPPSKRNRDEGSPDLSITPRGQKRQRSSAKKDVLEISSSEEEGEEDIALKEIAPVASPARAKQLEGRPILLTSSSDQEGDEEKGNEEQEDAAPNKIVSAVSPARAMQLMDIDIDELLPSPLQFQYKLRGKYWMDEIEADFQKLWVRSEHIGRFVASSSGMQNEVELWRLLLIRFNMALPQLFTYGLRLHEDCYHDPGSIMLSSEASYLLLQICVHPIWGTNFDSLRYVLQKAVALNVREHIEPIGPPPVFSLSKTTRQAGMRFSPRSKRLLEGVIQYDLWLKNKPDQEEDIRRLLSKIEIKTTNDQPEKVLYLLSKDVMESVVQALNGHERSRYDHSTVEYIQLFRRYNTEIYNHVCPRDIHELMALKWSCELCELRDLEIRRAMIDADSDDFLPDLPHGSTHKYDVPLYHHHPDFDERAVSLLRGWIPDPKRLTLMRLDREDPARAEELRAFSATLLVDANSGDAESTSKTRLQIPIAAPIPAASLSSGPIPVVNQELAPTPVTSQSTGPTPVANQKSVPTPATRNSSEAVLVHKEPPAPLAPAPVDGAAIISAPMHDLRLK